jgi:hypothetical protein
MSVQSSQPFLSLLWLTLCSLCSADRWHGRGAASPAVSPPHYSAASDTAPPTPAPQRLRPTVAVAQEHLHSPRPQQPAAQRRSLTPPHPRSRRHRRPSRSHSCTAWTRLRARSHRAAARLRRRPRNLWIPRGLRRLPRRACCVPVQGWARAAQEVVRDCISLLGLARCVWCGLRRWSLGTGARARCLCFSETEDFLHPFPFFFLVIHPFPCRSLITFLHMYPYITQCCTR